MATRSRVPLGQLLIEKNIITEEQLEQALAHQHKTGVLLGVALMELGVLSEEKVFLPMVANQIKVDYVELGKLTIPLDVITKIPAKFAVHYKVVPIHFENNVLTIATTKPLDIEIIDELSIVISDKIRTVLASEKDILEAIRKYYGVGAETIESMMGTVDSGEDVDLESQMGEIDSEASIGKFLNQILYQAYQDRATDIHFEPYEDSLQIRYRVDGVLHDANVPKNIKHFKDSINSRVKILSNLNIAEKRKPQDGRFKMKAKGVELDLRVSFLPTPYGESVVVRILNSSRLLTLKELGMSAKELRTVGGLIQKPHGIIFLTGPTGSGKTTTLYSCLSQINNLEKKIITIEDPIEYQLKGVTQIQINNDVGLTFAQGLRSMLRHDPDIMMVGEVRDAETAEVAIQCALTGHLIFSTLHTNDSASGVTRLMDMGIEPYLITSSVECFIAQRLVRILCPHCKKKVSMTQELIDESGGYLNSDAIVFEAVGCDSCHQMGYVGREGIYEILVMTDTIRGMIMERADAVKIKDLAVSNGMKTLLEAGWDLVQQGKATPQEVIRVTKEE